MKEDSFHIVILGDTSGEVIVNEHSKAIVGGYAIGAEQLGVMNFTAADANMLRNVILAAETAVNEARKSLLKYAAETGDTSVLEGLYDSKDGIRIRDSEDKE